LYFSAQEFFRRPYLERYKELRKAAEKLGLRAANCLVVEDAVSGITAARRAGCRCLAVSTSFDAEMLSEADWICDSLENAPDEALKW